MRTPEGANQQSYKALGSEKAVSHGPNPKCIEIDLSHKYKAQELHLEQREIFPFLKFLHNKLKLKPTNQVKYKLLQSTNQLESYQTKLRHTHYRAQTKPKVAAHNLLFNSSHHISLSKFNTHKQLSKRIHMYKRSSRLQITLPHRSPYPIIFGEKQVS